jgi:hypothetical protein
MRGRRGLSVRGAMGHGQAAHGVDGAGGAAGAPGASPARTVWPVVAACSSLAAHTSPASFSASFLGMCLRGRGAGAGGVM